MKQLKENKFSIFNYLKDICKFKTGKVHEKDDLLLSQFNLYMIMQFLSLNESYIPFLEMIEPIIYNLPTKEQQYKLLLNVLPRSDVFLRYPKAESMMIAEEDRKLLINYFHIGYDDANELLNLGLVNPKEIRQLYGGKI